MKHSKLSVKTDDLTLIAQVNIHWSQHFNEKIRLNN